MAHDQCYAQVRTTQSNAAAVTLACAISMTAWKELGRERVML
jgi:hypothetical protein